MNVSEELAKKDASWTGGWEHSEVPFSLPEFGVVSGKTALMIIDMQYQCAHPDWGQLKLRRETGMEVDYYVDRLQRVVIPNIRQLQQACREAGIPVIYVRVGAQTLDASDTSRHFKMEGILCPPGSKEAEIIEEIAPLPGEVVLSKTTSGVFNSTNADQMLRHMDIDTLIMTGVVTCGCVESSTREACDKDFNVLLVEDACATHTAERHVASIRAMHGRYALVRTTDEVLRQILELKWSEPLRLDTTG